ncbi:MAG: hypothetical protein SFW36_03490, partial [Leptolyngbyaceae cyanobacterium bins.59]|nr:hypothetical protein [Leptolyngbyaceae cyanobacterium bins.59]
GQVSEVSPPETIQTLQRDLENYQPQVTIVSPNPDEVLEESTVKVKLEVQDLPIFKEKSLGLGPHLHVILDNQPYKPVYDLSKPLVLEEVAPGTHTLRVFASRPWHESFKNAGAYTQTTFHILTRTPEQAPDPQKPLLTYSRPTGSYGAEPIMLDFYLTNAPLHLVAAEQPDDAIPDWKIRCTVNGYSFIVDRWEPIYLKGFKPGKNWVQLELLDEQDHPIENEFNDTVRLFTYEPNGNDTLSQLMRNEVKVADVRGITDPNYVPTPPAPPPAPSPQPPVPTTQPESTPKTAPSETPSPVEYPVEVLAPAETTSPPKPLTPPASPPPVPEPPAASIPAPAPSEAPVPVVAVPVPPSPSAIERPASPTPGSTPEPPPIAPAAPPVVAPTSPVPEELSSVPSTRPIAPTTLEQSFPPLKS